MIGVCVPQLRCILGAGAARASGCSSLTFACLTSSSRRRSWATPSATMSISCWCVYPSTFQDVLIGHPHPTLFYLWILVAILFMPAILGSLRAYAFAHLFLYVLAYFSPSLRFCCSLVGHFHDFASRFVCTNILFQFVDVCRYEPQQMR